MNPEWKIIVKKFEDAQACARHGVNEELKYFVLLTGLCFHPDTDFSEYVSLKTGKPIFSGRFAKELNGRLDECHAMCEKCGIDIYELSLNHIKPLYEKS